METKIKKSKKVRELDIRDFYNENEPSEFGKEVAEYISKRFIKVLANHMDLLWKGFTKGEDVKEYLDFGKDYIKCRANDFSSLDYSVLEILLKNRKD